MASVQIRGCLWADEIRIIKIHIQTLAPLIIQEMKKAILTLIL